MPGCPRWHYIVRDPGCLWTFTSHCCGVHRMILMIAMNCMFLSTKKLNLLKVTVHQKEKDPSGECRLYYYMLGDGLKSGSEYLGTYLPVEEEEDVALILWLNVSFHQQLLECEDRGGGKRDGSKSRENIKVARFPFRKAAKKSPHFMAGNSE